MILPIRWLNGVTAGSRRNAREAAAAITAANVAQARLNPPPVPAQRRPASAKTRTDA
jgi:hypothetical protein